MKVSLGRTEGGIVVGNAYDKYNTRNPIARRLMAGFHQAIDDMVGRVAPRTIHEVGCGEGYWTLRWAEAGIAARGSDFSTQVIDLARANAVQRGQSPDLFSQRNIYDLEPGRDGADLVVCCEVLEHLDDPATGLERLAGIVTGHLVISVPREPLWCLMNMARGKYLGSLGNTPGHIQHWSQRGFIRLVSSRFEVLEIRAPVPWTILLCRPRR